MQGKRRSNADVSSRQRQTVCVGVRGAKLKGVSGAGQRRTGDNPVPEWAKEETLDEMLQAHAAAV